MPKNNNEKPAVITAEFASRHIVEGNTFITVKVFLSRECILGLNPSLKDRKVRRDGRELPVVGKDGALVSFRIQADDWDGLVSNDGIEEDGVKFRSPRSFGEYKFTFRTIEVKEKTSHSYGTYECLEGVGFRPIPPFCFGGMGKLGKFSELPKTAKKSTSETKNVGDLNA